MHDRLMDSSERPDLLDVASFRRNYIQGKLHRSDLNPDPIRQFHAWLEEAAASPMILEANAMVLSTATAEGEVSSRTVLLKGYDESGFRFFTNTGSRKASEIATNASVALLFLWVPFERQIQITGTASPLPREATEAYFARRPRGSRIGAWASQQSSVLPDRETLERQAVEMEKRFEGMEILAPEFWGGYLVAPKTIEFWQGRENRLHDRFRYRREAGDWILERLSP